MVYLLKHCDSNAHVHSHQIMELLLLVFNSSEVAKSHVYFNRELKGRELETWKFMVGKLLYKRKNFTYLQKC